MSFVITYSIKAIDNFSKTLDNISKNFNKLNAKLNGHNRSLKTSGQHVNKLHTSYNKLFKAQNTNFKKLKSNFKGHTALARSSLSSINNKVLQIGKSSETAGETLAGMTKGIKTNNLDATYTKLGDIGNMAGAVGGKFKLMSKLGGLAAVAGVAAFSIKSISQASELKRTDIRLAPLIGNTKLRKKELDTIRGLAIKTGYKFADLAESFRLFTEANYTPKQAMAHTRQLTDIAAYTQYSPSEIAEIFTSAKLAGGMGVGTFQMLARRGINLYPEIAKSLGQKYDPKHQVYQQRMLNKMISAKPILTGQFDVMFSEYMKKKGIAGMAGQISQQTMGGKWGVTKSAISDITTSFGQLLTTSNALNGGFGALSGWLEKVAKRMRRTVHFKGWQHEFSHDHPASQKFHKWLTHRLAVARGRVPDVPVGMVNTPFARGRATDATDGMVNTPLMYDFKSLMSNVGKSNAISQSHVKIDLAADGFTHKSSYMKTDHGTKLDVGVNDDRL